MRLRYWVRVPRVRESNVKSYGCRTTRQDGGLEMSRSCVAPLGLASGTLPTRVAVDQINAQISFASYHHHDLRRRRTSPLAQGDARIGMPYSLRLHTTTKTRRSSVPRSPQPGNPSIPPPPPSPHTPPPPFSPSKAKHPSQATPKPYAT